MTARVVSAPPPPAALTTLSGNPPTPRSPVLSSPRSILRKRNFLESVQSGSQDHQPPSPSKRPKVDFDKDVQVHFVQQGLADALLVQREEIRRALDRYAAGESDEYTMLKDLFSGMAPHPFFMSPHDQQRLDGLRANLRGYILGLTYFVSRLGEAHATLIKNIIWSDWIAKDTPYVDATISFFGSLMSVRPSWRSEVLEMLVQHLTISGGSQIEAESMGRLKRSTVYERAHQALNHVVSMASKARTMLLDTLKKSFPDPGQSFNAHVVFVRNLLEMSRYLPGDGSDVVSLVMRRAIDVDIAFQEALEDLEDEIGESMLQRLSKTHVPTIEQLGSCEDIDDADIDDELPPDEAMSEAQRREMIVVLATNLDCILHLVFEHYESDVSHQDPFVHDEALARLLTHFQRDILPSPRSRHIQFLPFHFCQTSEKHTDLFAGALISLAYNEEESADIRQAAAAYLGSFVARGAHVPTSVVRDVFAYLGQLLGEFRQQHEPDCQGPNLRQYATYYALFQALIYMFCFRWRNLTTEQDESPELDAFLNGRRVPEDGPATDRDDDYRYRKPTWVTGVREVLHSNIFSPLNPLKVCSPIIVSEFAHIVRELQCVYVHSLLETNKRVKLLGIDGGHGSENTAVSSQEVEEPIFHLEEYYPFDPPLLPFLQQLIEKDYRRWKSLPVRETHDTERSRDSSSENERIDSDGDPVSDGVLPW